MTAYTADLSKKPYVQAFFDEATNTISYIVQDPSSTFCAIIDSVMDIDYAAGRITFEQADTLIKEIERRELKLEWIIETHVHADHLSAAPYIQEKLGGKIGVGIESKITFKNDNKQHILLQQIIQSTTDAERSQSGRLSFWNEKRRSSRYTKQIYER